MNNEELKSNLLSSKHWIRLAYMVLFAIILYVVSFIMSVVVIIQFIISLITGQNNLNLRSFGYSLSTYIYQTLQFLTYNSEEKPFPFADWPKAPDIVPEATEVAASAPKTAADSPADDADVSEESTASTPKKPRAKKAAKTDEPSSTDEAVDNKEKDA